MKKTSYFLTLYHCPSYEGVKFVDSYKCKNLKKARKWLRDSAVDMGLQLITPNIAINMDTKELLRIETVQGIKAR